MLVFSFTSNRDRFQPVFQPWLIGDGFPEGDIPIELRFPESHQELADLPVKQDRENELRFRSSRFVGNSKVFTNRQ